MKTIIATLLLATLSASAQGLTRDIVIASTTLTVLEGRIVGLVEPPPPPKWDSSPSTAEPHPKQSLGLHQRLAERRARDAAPQPTPKTAPAATTPVALGPVYDIDISSMSGVRITVTSTNTFTNAQLRRWLREAAQQLPNR